MSKIGIIGGSGLENPDILENSKTLEMSTPYGSPSSPLKTGTINGVEVILLSRHGFSHGIPPSKVNNRANIFALKEAGCSKIIATTACGSLRADIDRGHLVILDQFIDFTRHREVTFFDAFKEGDLKHAAMAEPFAADMREILITTSKKLNLKFHQRGTVITIEGPRFSTRAESNMFRAWGADVINMSIAPEVILANELEIPYAGIAMSTDYDCWKTDEAPVTWEDVLEIFRMNVHRVVELIRESLPKLVVK
jgi:5'-methylthioadenosine phosphorylase